MTDEKVLSVKQVMAVLGCSKTTVHQYIKSGELKSFKLNRSRKVLSSDLQQFLWHYAGRPMSIKEPGRRYELDSVVGRAEDILEDYNHGLASLIKKVEQGDYWNDLSNHRETLLLFRRMLINFFHGVADAEPERWVSAVALEALAQINKEIETFDENYAVMGNATHA